MVRLFSRPFPTAFIPTDQVAIIFFLFSFFLLLFDIIGERFPKRAKRLFKQRLNGKQWLIV